MSRQTDGIRGRRLWLAAPVLLALTQPVQAGYIEWTDWTSGTGLFGFADAIGQTDSATGQIALPDGNDIGVSWTGNAWNVFTTGLDDPLATSPWTLIGPDGTDYAPYTSATVDNAPLVYEEIGLQFEGTSTLTFSTPIVDPVFAIKSLGSINLSVSYMFDAPFTVLSGFNYSSIPFVPDPNHLTVTGNEFNGTIQFSGVFTSLSWDIDVVQPGFTGEYRHYFTVGTGQQAVVQSLPEPAAMLLLGIGLAGLVGASVRGKRGS